MRIKLLKLLIFVIFCMNSQAEDLNRKKNGNVMTRMLFMAA